MLISSHPTASISLGSDAQLALGAGINIPPATVALVLDIETFGNIVQKGVYAIASAAVTIGIIEVYQEDTWEPSTPAVAGNARGFYG